MAKARSPRYPAISLPEAIEKVTAVYKKDFRNKIPKNLVAEHMGFGGLHGASLAVISAVSKYGLLDGGRDSMWVTPLAVDIIERERDDPERMNAIQTAAATPELFRELDQEFPEKASDSALRSFLVTKRDFLPDAAVKLIRSYRETKELVDADCDAHDFPSPRMEASPSSVVVEPAPAQLTVKGNAPTVIVNGGEREWLRGPLSRGTSYRLVVHGDMGPKELGKLIKLLKAQQAVLEDDEEDESVTDLEAHDEI